MDDTQFCFSRSSLALVIFAVAYGMVFWLVLAALPAGSMRGAALLVLAVLAFGDLRRCGVYRRESPAGLKLYRQRWQLLLADSWATVDLAVHYRGRFLFILCWRARDSQRLRYFVLWRDMLAPAQWRLLTVYLSLFPMTRACDT